jgi:hypothetical protein
MGFNELGDLAAAVPVEDAEHAVGFVPAFHLQLADLGVLHAFAPALHLAARELDAFRGPCLHCFLGFGLAQVDSH